jgi:hypothetical protein
MAAVSMWRRDGIEEETIGEQVDDYEDRKAVKTSSTCPSTLTFLNTALRLPLGSMTNVLRSIPQYFFPYMFFSL